jgi:5-formyltetrahydrofolate cyclo-ligase
LVQASATAAKTLLRLQLRAQRKTLAARAPDAAEQAAQILPLDRLGRFAVVSGYRPQGAELDPWPLMSRFAEAGAQLVLPVVVDREGPLVFRAFAPGDPLVPDAVGVAAPTSEAPEREPDLVIAPLLAFDRRGNRMGQGAGHYDRTLAALRARGPVFVLGLAYGGQEVARVPAEPHDQPLDAILTEMAYIDAQRDH